MRARWLGDGQLGGHLTIKDNVCYLSPASNLQSNRDIKHPTDMPIS